MAKISVVANPLFVAVISDDIYTLLYEDLAASLLLDEIYKSERDFKTVCNNSINML